MEAAMGYKTVLVPLDGSAIAELALRHVPKVADPGAVVHVLSVVAQDNSILAAIAMAGGYADSPMVQEAVALSPFSPELVHGREDYLRHAVEPLREMGYSVTIDARPGDVINCIIDTARNGYDAIIMATHGRSGLPKALLGSI